MHLKYVENVLHQLTTVNIINRKLTEKIRDLRMKGAHTHTHTHKHMEAQLKRFDDHRCISRSEDRERHL